MAATDARAIAAQTNDRLLTVLLFDRAEDLTSDTILFDDRLRTHLTLAPGAVFREIRQSDHDIVFQHTVEPVGQWGIEVDGRIVATGGLRTTTIPPYGDIFMEVAEPHSASRVCQLSDPGAEADLLRARQRPWRSDRAGQHRLPDRRCSEPA